MLGNQESIPNTDNSAADISQEPKRRKKKVSRACVNCKKSHLFCEEKRPCFRCVKKNIAHLCIDTKRKPTKYLDLDKEDLHLPNKFKKNKEELELEEEAYNLFKQSDGFEGDSLTFAANDNNGFYSTLANLEYKTLNEISLAQTSVVSNSSNNNTIESILNKNFIRLSNEQLENPQSIQENTLGVNATSSTTANEGTEEYEEVSQPYNHCPGYHYLLKYISTNMRKEQIIRICRAISKYRPSIINLIKDITTQDLIFVEKGFKRLVKEYEKTVSKSGTPTAIWRRNGEIVIIGKEFLMLTKYQSEDFFNKTSYIFELMNSQSVVTFFERFSEHAFDNTKTTINMKCMLKIKEHPKGAKAEFVPCMLCFTVKRDIFDIPQTIIGNFLPILD